MLAAVARLLEKYFKLPFEQGIVYLNRLVITLAAMLFILISTMIVAFDSFFPGQTALASLQVGDIVREDIFAPRSITYISRVLTEQRREAARASVTPFYDLPDPVVARQQTGLARQILDFIENVRRDPYAEPKQKMSDLEEITALALDDLTMQQILEIDQDTWDDVDDQIMAVLESVFQDEIRESSVSEVRRLLPNQVSVRFDDRETNVIVAIVSDLIRPNTRLNQEATEAARQAAAAAVQDEPRSFERGQIVVSSGTRLSPVDYEALEQFGLLRPAESRVQDIIQALLASIIVMVIVGLYIGYFRPALLYEEPRMISLLAAIFLLVLLGARLGLIGQIYIYPTATLALIFVAIVGPQIAIIGVLGLAFLVGLMANSSLEIASLVLVGGIIGSLTLHRAERLNSFFIAGLMVAVGNMAVVALFNLNTPQGNNPANLALLIVYVLLNGILTAAAALAGLYIVTLLFNLPTALKLAELSQPNQPLLQRLLREAPGTYQHSLQVANLSEQAANAIGANAELTHVAALYHDIGKMLNPAFFTENQQYIGNPHDTLNDPYRSADIIISHVTEGAEMAKQYRLPNRFRDFILEHHGTSQVYVFYKQAVILAGDDETLVDASDFSYPGPKPRTRETAVLMLADSCEAAVRSRQPKTREEIEQTIISVIDGKRQSGQLDDSGLTLADLKLIQNIFVEMLQAMFHPRINYTEAIARARRSDKAAFKTGESSTTEKVVKKTIEIPTNSKRPDPATTSEVTRPSPPKKQTVEAAAALDDDDDDAPLPEVPRLRRMTDTKPDANNGDYAHGTVNAEHDDVSNRHPE